MVLAAQTQHVGDMVTFSVINDNGNPSNSIREDGGISSIGGSQASRQQSAQVAAVDSSQGPMVFAVYYPPADSRGSQDDQLGSRNIQIEMNPQGPGPTETPAVP